MQPVWSNRGEWVEIYRSSETVFRDMQTKRLLGWPVVKCSRNVSIHRRAVRGTSDLLSPPPTMSGRESGLLTSYSDCSRLWEIGPLPTATCSQGRKQNLPSLWIPLLSRDKGLARTMLDLHQNPLKCYIPLGHAMLRKHIADSCRDLL